MQEKWDIFRAFTNKLDKDIQTEADNKLKIENCVDLYLQRLGKCLIDSFHTFFIPEIMSLYQGLDHF
jgi:hypothetical protein